MLRAKICHVVPLRLMCDGSSRVAGLFRRGDDQEALELFQDLLDVSQVAAVQVGDIQIPLE